MVPRGGVAMAAAIASGLELELAVGPRSIRMWLR